MSGARTEVLRGVLERILFHNEENAYTVGELRPDAGGEPVTVTGNLAGVQCGETLRLEGEWTRHPRHGAQFRARSFRSELPATVHGIRKFLGSGLVPGIGRVMANRIVDRFGERTFAVISEESVRLREVEGIGPQRATAIKRAWDEQAAVREVMVFLQTHGVGPALGQKLVRTYGDAAQVILRTEPYRVAREVPGIGFRTADRIALNLGLGSDGAERLEAGVAHAAEAMEEAGHTAPPREELVAAAVELLEAPRPKVEERVDALVERGDLIVRGERLLRPPTDRQEGRLAEAIVRVERGRSGLPPIRTEAAVAWAQERAGFRFSPEQARAVRAALEGKLTLLTGGPGTGKTTILRALVAILRAKQVRVHLAAPTGRAAQRLAEATDHPAQTLHRVLKFDAATGGFVHHEHKPLPTDFLIVDEASMLDTRLAASAIAAVPATANVVLVGDADQLPSIGAGNVLQDVLASRPEATTRLGRIYRQAEGSLIVEAAHAINEGRVVLPSPVASVAAVDWSKDLHYLPAPTPAECAARVLEVAAAVQRATGLDPLRDVQVLAPMHKGEAGVGNLNQSLQTLLNPSVSGVRGAGATLLPGDKVIQLRNNYEKGLFNGDVGYVREVDPMGGDLVAEFEGVAHTFDRAAAADLALAYAMTIHKAQGSEYPVVILPLVKAHFVMLTRNLLYTGVTRGKRKVFIVGDAAAFAMAVRTSDTRVRWTWLRERLVRRR